MKFEKELNDALYIIREAQKVVLDVYMHADFTVETKSDNSPVTIADKTSDKLIHDYLKEKYPTYGLLTEESIEQEGSDDRLSKEYVWIVDPLDGTKNFIAHDDEFTINIALSYKGDLVLGVVLIPCEDVIYYAVKGEGAYKLDSGVTTRIHVSDRTDHLIVLTSVFHKTDEEQTKIDFYHEKIERVSSCGSSIKACLIAEGKADLSYRLNPNTKEWDSAAIQIIVIEAGGIFQTPEGEIIKYNKEDVYNHDGYIICNRKENVLL